MPRVEVTQFVPVSPDVAFEVSQTQGEERYRWDRFVRSQQLLDGATHPAVGVRTLTRSRHGLKMVSQYTSVKPPTQVGMKMVEGPWFFQKFGGGWLFKAVNGGTEVTWRYTFSTRPGWLAPLMERLGSALLTRDITNRLEGFAEGCVEYEQRSSPKSSPPKTK